MSTLRKQLQHSRVSYRGLQYPGRLASEVLPPVAPAKFWRNRLLTGALAAAAAIVVLAWPRPAETITGPVVTGPTAADVIELAPISNALVDADADDAAETETVSYVIDDIPTLPEIGPLWAQSQDESTEDAGQLVPAFPSFTELPDTVSAKEADR